MELTYKPRGGEERSCNKKSESKRIRREGGITAVIYSKGEQGKEIEVSRAAFQKLLQSIPKRSLSAQVITLKNEKGKAIRAIVKGIEYAITTYEVQHLDFLELHDDVFVTLNIPLRFEGTMDCVGVKLGGVIRPIVEFVKVRALPKDIPTHFEINVRDLNLGQSKRLEEIALPQGVVPVTDLKEVAVVIAKR